MRGNRVSGAACVIAVATLLSSMARPAYAEDVLGLQPLSATASASSAAADETASEWFIELASPPAAKGTSRGKLKAERDAFRAAAAQAQVTYQERFAYETLWNGIAVEVSRSELKALARLDGVRAVYPVVSMSVPQTQPTLDAELAAALAMTGANAAQSGLGLTGAGIRVGVIDSGIDYHHPDLGGCFGPGCRVAAGADFVGDAFDADGAKHERKPRPDANPDDCNGHGTHVAGIIGANGALKGVAPGVTLGAYRVLGCDGSTSADIVLAALERALADGMRVVNISVGAPYQWPSYPTALAADRLVDAGVVVVASVGNNGASGLYSASAPGVGAKVIGVASFDNSHVNAATFTLAPDGRRVAHLTLEGAPDAPVAGTVEVVYVGSGCPGQAYVADPVGKVALMERGVCSFNDKYARAADAGAVGVLVYNTMAGIFGGGGIVSRDIFGAAISQADGLLIRSRLAGGAVTLTWTETRVSAPNPTGGRISAFSSYGMSPDLTLKPDLAAPGGLIRSTWPLERGGYKILSGTSMAAPHVAGAAALLLEARPATPASAVNGMLQNSADPKAWSGNPALGHLDHVHRQGAGMLDIDDAVLATTAVTPGKLSLGESASTVRSLTIRNTAAAPVTYDLSHAGALSTGPSTFAPTFLTGWAQVRFSPASLTVPAGGVTTVSVTITPNGALPERSQYGGYLVLTPRGGGQVYRVPYAGFKGDYQSLRALTPTTQGFPWLARRVSDTGGELADWTKQSDGATYTFKHHEDVPWVLLHLDHPVQQLTVDVLDGHTGESQGRAFEAPFVGRSSEPTSFYALEWDGKTKLDGKTKVVHDGTYILKVSALKALGDWANAAHWETWTSPSFVIERGLGHDKKPEAASPQGSDQP
jgi:minor extracellular serine protease Vpr